MSARALAKFVVPLAVAAQLAVLVWMAGEREWILRTGQVVYLRTAPVDPRDLFRGDFVRLQYEINEAQAGGREPGADSWSTGRRHQVVYTRLRPTGDGLFEAAGSGPVPPREGLFLRGRTEDAWRLGWRGSGQMLIKYGIEQLFVEQGEGLAIEQKRGARGTLQVPMEVEVAIGHAGTAVIRGYRWSRLGMRLEIIRQPEQVRANAPPPTGPLSPKVRVTLANASDAPLGVVDSADHCTFHLLPVQREGSPGPPAAYRCEAAATAAGALINLAPGQSHSVELDLSEARWHVLADGKPVEIGALQEPLAMVQRFRLEYRVPGTLPAEARGVWRGRIASQAFTARGAID